MNSSTERVVLAGPAGDIECAVDRPMVQSRGVAVVCHPHPLHGGTLHNKVVQTLARAFVALGYRSVRFNFRGTGDSQGRWDEGRGEIDDALAVIASQRRHGERLLLAGFSFGGFVASQVAARLANHEQVDKVDRVVLVAPATTRFDVAAVPAGTLVIHGESDEVVPLSATLDWARPQGLPIVVVPGCGHFFHGQLPLLKTLVQRACAAA